MLDAKRLGLAGGILWGLSMFVMTIVSMYTGYAGDWMGMMANMYPGYHVTWAGSLVGFIYGFIDGFIGLFLLAWIYNKISW